MKMTLKKAMVSTLVSFISAAGLFAVDLTFRISPSILLPLKENYKPALTGFVQADVDLFGFLTAGLEGNFSVETPNNMTSSLIAIGGGVGLGAYYYPMSRLHIGAGGAFGIYSASMKVNNSEEPLSDLYWRAYGEVGYRLNPTITVNGFGGYMSYMVNGTDPLMAGPYFGVSARISLTVGKSGDSGFRISVDQSSPAYPVFMGVYKDNGFATATITNQEGAEIKDVQVSFRAGKYTTETQLCESIPRINKYSSVEIPLTAAFSDEILKFSENGKISGEVVIDYKLLGTKKQMVQNVIVDVYNRNAFSWDDSAALAAFISPKIPEVSQFSKYVSGIARNGYRTGLSRNLETAAAMTEAIRLADVEYSEDQVTPYTEFHLGSELDSIQLPLQTMNNLGGDYDDLGLFLASCLESVGIPTGYLISDDDFIVLVDMEIKPSSAGNHFGDTSTLVVDDTTVYFGLSMKNLAGGFIKSLTAAGKTIQQANNAEIYCEYVNTREAWTIYKSTVYTGTSGMFKTPGQTQLEKAYENALNTYSNTEIKQVIANARASGDPNKLGLALVRVGRYSEAKAEFAKSDSVSAMNNLANVYIIEGNYDAAIRQFNKVLAVDPENATALKGIDKANSLKGL